MKKKIAKLIKQFENIVIVRHINVDPDAMGSSLALKETIKKTYPKKNVYLIGNSSVRFNYMGRLDHVPTVIDKNKTLLIVLDTPDKKRLDLKDFSSYSYSIKIDHHPFMEKFCDLEFIDEHKSSASELVYDLINETNLKMDKHIAELLFYGIVGDTGRFLFSNSTSTVFYTVGNLLKKYKLDIEKLYFNLYHKPLNEFRLQGYMAENMEITKNGVGYIKLTKEVLEKYHMDSASSGNSINEFNNVDDFVVWLSATEDIKNDNIRVSIRSRGPIINEIALKYNGGGHKVASGARVNSFEEVDLLIEELDKACLEYKKSGDVYEN